MDLHIEFEKKDTSYKGCFGERYLFFEIPILNIVTPTYYHNILFFFLLTVNKLYAVQSLGCIRREKLIKLLNFSFIKTQFSLSTCCCSMIIIMSRKIYLMSWYPSLSTHDSNLKNRIL